MMLCIEPLKSNVADDVIECGACHGATKSLLPFYAQHLDTSAIGGQDMINAGCQYYEICSEMKFVRKWFVFMDLVFCIFMFR